MVACPSCRAEVDDEARFCPKCGMKLEQPGRLSDFEIGKIAALDTIKKDILKWVGGLGSVIGITFAILAYFGVNETLKGSVTEQVKSELKQNRQDIDKAIRDLYIAYGKAQKDQETLTRVLGESLSSITSINDAKTRLQGDIGDTSKQLANLKNAVRSADEERQKLEEILKGLNVASLIGKLRYDFYHVRDFGGSLELTVKSENNKINEFNQIRLDLWEKKVAIT